MNLANKITLSRIFLVPVFLIFIIPFPEWMIENQYLHLISPWMNFINTYGNFFAAAIFVIAASTDAVDGYIARSRGMVSNLGKFLDPIADKLLITAALIALVERNEITTWAAIIIIAREFIITGLRQIAAGEGLIIAASAWGKVKMVAQTIAIVLTLLNNYPFSLFTTFELDNVAMVIAILVTIYSGIDYVVKNKHVLAEEKK